MQMRKCNNVSANHVLFLFVRSFDEKYFLVDVEWNYKELVLFVDFIQFDVVSWI